MSPLAYLAIPLITFIVGSSVLYLFSRHRGGRVRYRNAPEDLRGFAPMVEQQREVGWPVRSGQQYSRR